MAEVFEYFIKNFPEHKRLLAEEVMPVYPKILENIIEIIKSVGATPIICSPTPFDEYTEGEKKWLGTEKDLAIFSEIARETAERRTLIEERSKKFPDYEPFKVYIENVDYLDELRGELVKKTLDIYE